MVGRGEVVVTPDSEQQLARANVGPVPSLPPSHSLFFIGINLSQSNRETSSLIQSRHHRPLKSNISHHLHNAGVCSLVSSVQFEVNCDVDCTVRSASLAKPNPDSPEQQAS